MWSSSSPRASYEKCLLLFALSVLSVLCIASKSEAKTVTLFCPDIPRKEAILTVAFQAGVEVVFFEDIPGKVNVRRESIAFEDALDLILQGTGIVWHEKNGVYYIGTPEEGTPEYLKISDIETCTTRFRTSREILALHPEFAGNLLPTSPFRFLVVGPKRVREAIQNAVAALDRPREHILLRVVVFEGEEKLFEDSGFSFLDTQKLFTFPSPKHRERLQGQLTLRGKGEEATRRLEQELLVLEGEWGESRVGERVYYRVEEGGLGALEVVELGTGLRAQPLYREDGRIATNLEVEVTDTAREDSLIVVRRTFKTSAILEEGVVTPLVLEAYEETQSKAWKLFESRSAKGRPERETRSEKLMLLVEAKRQNPGDVSSLARLEGPPLKFQVTSPERDLWDTQVFLEYRSPGPFLSVGFETRWEETVEIRGNLLAGLSGKPLWGSLELAYRVAGECLGIRWEGTPEKQGWSVFFESRKQDWNDTTYFFRLGTGWVGEDAVGFVTLGGAHRRGDFSFEGRLTYQMASITNLRLDLEGRWRVSKNTSLIAGYSGLLTGEKTPLDDLRFEGVFVGLRITF